MQESTATASERRAALLVATIASFVTPFMSSSVNIALPSIGNEFSMDAVMLGWVATAFILAAAMFLVPFGKIADIYGRKRIFSIGIWIYTISSLGCGLAASPAQLILGRVCQGIGCAMIFGNSVAILTSVFPANDRGRVLGISVAAVYFGLSLGPFIGGLMTDHLGWRSIFFANMPLGLLILWLVYAQLKGEWKGIGGEKFDVIGSLLYCLSLLGVMYGFSELPASMGMISLIAGLAGIALFVSWELIAAHPILNMNLFIGNAVFAFSNLAALINYSATFAVGFLLSLYLQYIRGLSPDKAGIILVAQPVMQAVFSPCAGKLSDRVDSRIVASIGMAVVVVGLAMLVFLERSTGVAYIVSSLVILGFGFALFSSPNTNAVMGSVEKKVYGVASATIATMRLIGQMLSMGIAMLIFSVVIGKVEITPEYYDRFLVSTRIAFTVFSILCFLGVFASLARGRRNASRE
jgi:EmrB/QacA subfamily drug resistance transporter